MAQSGSAPGLGPGGRKFESCCPDHCWLLSVLSVDPSKQPILRNSAFFGTFFDLNKSVFREGSRPNATFCAIRPEKPK